MTVQSGFVCLIFQRPCQQLGYIMEGPHTDVWQLYVLPHTRQSRKTMTSVSAGHIILIPSQPVGSGRLLQKSNPGPPHQESPALPTELPRSPSKMVIIRNFWINSTGSDRNLQKKKKKKQVCQNSFPATLNFHAYQLQLAILHPAFLNFNCQELKNLTEIIAFKKKIIVIKHYDSCRRWSKIRSNI